MQEMKSLFFRSMIGVILGVGLVTGLAYLFPSRGQPAWTIATPAAAEFVGHGGASAGSPQALGSIGGGQFSLSSLFIVLATSGVLATAILLISRRES